MNLSKKLILSFVLSIIISIFIISTISNTMINNRFDKYLIREQNKKFDEIYLDINKMFIEKGQNLQSEDINNYARKEEIYLEVRGINDRPICRSQHMSPGKMMGRMGMHHHKTGNPNLNKPGKYTEKTFPLLNNNDEPIGTLIIGYVDNSHLTESAILFKNTLSKSFFISGVITIILGFIISITLSRGLTNPILNITHTANQIRNGNLKSRSNVKSNVREIVQLSHSINYLGKTLKEQEDLRKRYALDISHELRTPLTTLKSHLEAMVDGVWDISPEHLNILIEEIDGLANLVEDLKNTFTEMEGQLNINKVRFNISEELRNIISEFRPLFDEKGYLLESSIEKNIEINMDKYRLKQIIYNLLSNAIKYLGENGKVLVCLKKEKKKVKITVEDNGIGIDERDLPFIFERFYRADVSRNRKTGGTGLGLSITKTLMEAHNGSIYVKSEKNKGTKFTILIPL